MLYDYIVLPNKSGCEAHSSIHLVSRTSIHLRNTPKFVFYVSSSPTPCTDCELYVHCLLLLQLIISVIWPYSCIAAQQPHQKQ